jgi:hypothetical protein
MAAPVRLAGAGVDTWSPSWWVDPASPAARWFQANAMESKRGWMLPDPLCEHRVGMFASGLIWAEGHPRPGGLAGARELVGAYDQLCHELIKVGVPLPVGHYRVLRDGTRVPGAAGLRRLDVTADVAFPSRLHGQTYMSALQAVVSQRGRSSPHGGLGLWETVELRTRTGRQLTGRVYDKGLESTTAPPFRLLRFEDQGRFRVADRRPVAAVDAAYLRERFRRRFRFLSDAGRQTGVITVAEPTVLCARIFELLREGAISRAQAERMAGTVMLEFVGSGEVIGERTTAWRRRQELIEHGIVRDTGELHAPMEVRLDEPADLCAPLAIWS